MANLTGKGGFEKGKSGNPNGRPAKSEEEKALGEACRAKSERALEVIASIMENGENERNRITAALSIIERAYGKPAQSIDLGGQEDNPLITEIVVKVIEARG